MTWRTGYYGDGTPHRMPVEPDPDIALEQLLDELERDQEDYDKTIEDKHETQ